ncbi:YopX family protein [Faecalimonas umbilicata]|uniref:YopX family protein n=1 Tax=Faecalimonas umbilicata TaxID=1912855 RepID=UPI0022E5F5F0|nr:YopX family protein [Faecalimonas umbilicata]
MNREILFKAKRIDNGEWVEGQYAYITNPLTEDGKPIKHLICNGTNIFNDLIDPDTLCQYTGLTDKNGKKIWENDIVKCLKRTEGYELYQVVWRNEFADFGVEPIKPKYGAKYPIGLSDGVTLCGHDYRAFGNIFDNPELLEVE